MPALRQPHGFLRGSVPIPDGVDPTEAMLDESLGAEHGKLHA